MKSLSLIPALLLPLLGSCDGDKETTGSDRTKESGPEKVAAETQSAAADPNAPAKSPGSRRPDAGTLAGTPASILQQRKSADFEDASTRFGEYLRASGCVGKALSEVKDLLGKPDAETADSISYRFESGFGGWDWVINHDGQKITGFSRKGVN